MTKKHSMRNALYILFISVIITIQGCCQTYKSTGMIEDEKFDKKLFFMLDRETPAISVDSLHGHKEDFILLDARSKDEFDVSHIKGAHYVGYKDFSIEKIPSVPKGKKIVVYCSVGYRSEKIVKEIREKTDREALNLYGSIFEWANRGYPIVNSDSQLTQKIHTYNRKWSKWMSNSELKKVW